MYASVGWVGKHEGIAIGSTGIRCQNALFYNPPFLPSPPEAGTGKGVAMVEVKCHLV